MGQTRAEQEEIQEPPNQTGRFPQLPYELIEEILQKLPVKSLLQFKSISKRWRSTIESQDFVKAHRIHQKSREPKIIGASISGAYPNISLSITFASVEEDKETSPSYTLLDRLCDRFEISESFDGLVCTYSVDSIYVFNPATRECRELPIGIRESGSLCQKPDYVRLKFRRWKVYYISVGLCQNSPTETYKVVRIHKIFNLFDRVYECEVFSLRDNTWRYVCQVPYKIYEQQKPIFAYGSFHWFTEDAPEGYTNAKILSFSIHDEEFHLVPHPCTDTAAGTSNTILTRKMFNLRNRLCLSDFVDPRLDIWGMDPNGRWEKMCSIDLYSVILSLKNYQISTLLAVCKKGRIVTTNGEKLFMYYPETESFRLLCERKGNMAVYFESLVSPF